MARRLLLVSTSTTHGTGYLDHCAGQIQDLLNNLRRVGLREGAMLRIEGAGVRLHGSTGARIFRRGHPPLEARPGEALDFLLAGSA